MKNNQSSAENRSNNDRRNSQAQAANRSAAVILLLAILFFLLALGVYAKAMGFSLSDWLMMKPSSGINRTNTNTGTGAAPGRPGAPGSNGSGTNGTGTNGTGTNGTGTNGTNTDNPNAGTNLNLKTDNGTDINVGVDDQGRLYVTPSANPNPQGGTGAEVNLNKQKVIDTNSLLQ